MGPDSNHDVFYPTKDDIMSIHEDIIEEDDDAEPGILNDGTVNYALNCIEHGHFGQVPETLHEKAVMLLRLLSANHSFADGNKRTALNTTWTFYALNGYYFDYGEEIKAILKLFAVMERMVDQEEVADYFEEIALPEDHERVPTEVVRLIHLTRWRKNVIEQSEAFLQEVRNNPDQVSPEEFMQHIRDVDEMVAEFLEFRDEFEEELPEGVLDFIGELEENWTETLTEIRDLLSEVIEDQGEPLEES
ncbi:type II toxin-antitoxin system death-on-curing family toxin [Haloplanus halobius]|uniref:type II toxin-antitoxin system death-on-curing family toxin n=1 Tax=Haloplanus halobius TaxID=2934938 RepID=UPI00200F0AAD|nr:type II toxin-antitoxin system death-on-curing family toxin [Haloplanus sp. XH21]